jgi:hypothetical protein
MKAIASAPVPPPPEKLIDGADPYPSPVVIIWIPTKPPVDLRPIGMPNASYAEPSMIVL